MTAYAPDDRLVDERVRLSPAGRRGLSASFAYPRPAALAATRPTALRPSSTPTPVRSR
ncbi:hypothetical protein ACFWR9_08245 [Streptomyces sp. NPDC058534]|uniref:hypothetical protein n=1 Tax=Streptomyces sp. NPDC058534 TaxID=3346541 RepID=UPI00364ABDFD